MSWTIRQGTLSVTSGTGASVSTSHGLTYSQVDVHAGTAAGDASVVEPVAIVMPTQYGVPVDMRRSPSKNTSISE